MSNTQTQRGPGRPANFPKGTQTVAFLAKIPVSTKAMVTSLAENREEPIGVTLDRMIRRAYSESSLGKGRKPSAS